MHTSPEHVAPAAEGTSEAQFASVTSPCRFGASFLRTDTDFGISDDDAKKVAVRPDVPGGTAFTVYLFVYCWTE